MKILFSTLPAYGHVYPLMPLVLAARDGGHDVTVATTGNFVPMLTTLGVTTRDVGISLEDARRQVLAMLGEPRMPRAADGRPDVDFAGRLFIDVLARRRIADLAPLLAQLEPDLVVYEQFDLGAGVAAHLAGIAAVCHALSPRMPADVERTVAGDRLERVWAEHGVATPSFDVFTGDTYLDIFPDALQRPEFLAHPSRVRLRPVPFAEAGALLPDWVGARGRPFVYLTLGTVVGTDDVLRPVIEGLGTLDVDVLLALGSADGAALGAVPPNIHVESFVDQPAVLRHADLAVHHGGSGTMLGALTSGTPQLLLPQGADQFWNAEAMAGAGLAAVLEPRDVTPDAVAVAVEHELGNRRSAVDAIRAELAAMPDPADVLDGLLDEIAGRAAAA